MSDAPEADAIAEAQDEQSETQDEQAATQDATAKRQDDQVAEQVESDSSTAGESKETIGAAMPRFEDLVDVSSGGGTGFDRFFDVKVSVYAELGSIEMPIGELLKLGEGSVVELNRLIAEPVDLVSQGVKIAKGEVVVVDDCFAVRITEILGTS